MIARHLPPSVQLMASQDATSFLHQTEAASFRSHLLPQMHSCSYEQKREVMEGVDDDGFRTVECLRGRLLAERVASKAAKEEAEHMSDRLLKLERLLASEIKCRNKAERRLKRAMKKLESLRLVAGIPNLSRVSSEEILGGNSEIQSRASSLGSSPQEKPERDQHLSDSKRKIDGGQEEEGAASSSDSARPSMSGNRSCSSVGTALSVNNKGSRPFSTSSADQDECARSDKYVNDDSLALVPANMWLVSEDEKPRTAAKSDPGNPLLEARKSGSSNISTTQMDSNVYDVLVALQRAKEQLRSSLHHSTGSSNPQRASLQWCMSRQDRFIPAVTE